MTKFKKVVNFFPIVSMISGVLADLVAVFYMLNYHLVFFDGLSGLKPELYLLFVGYLLSIFGIIIGVVGIIGSDFRWKASFGIVLSLAFFVFLSY